MTNYSIKDLERISGVKAHTLRMWEQRYDFVQPKRTGTNIRYYSDEDLKLILNVTFLKNHGFKIAEINKMPNGELQKKVIQLTEHQYGHVEQMHALTLAMIELNEEKFDKIFSTHILQNGIERTMTQFIFPFFEKMRILWQSGSINSIQKQFIKNQVRQKLIVAIDGQFVSPDDVHNTYVLLAPPGEKNEIRLLFSNLILKRRKNKVIYLGLHIQPEDLESLSKNFHPEFLLTFINKPVSQNKISQYYHALVNAFPNSQLLISGKKKANLIKNLPLNGIFLDSTAKLIAFVESTSE